MYAEAILDAGGGGRIVPGHPDSSRIHDDTVPFYSRRVSPHPSAAGIGKGATLAEVELPPVPGTDQYLPNAVQNNLLARQAGLGRTAYFTGGERRSLVGADIAEDKKSFPLSDEDQRPAGDR